MLNVQPQQRRKLLRREEKKITPNQRLQTKKKNQPKIEGDKRERKKATQIER